jgi:signal transduction histidine kinase
MKIRTKIILAFLLIALISGTTGYVNLINTDRISKRFDELHYQVVPTFSALKDTRLAAVNVAASTKEFSLAEDVSAQAVQRRLIEQGKSQLSAAIRNYDQLVTTFFPEERNVRDGIIAKSAQFKAASDKLVGVKLDKGTSADILSAQASLDASGSELLKAIDAALDIEQIKIKESEGIFASVLDNTIYLTLGIIIASVSVALIIGWSIYRSISKPIIDLKGATHEISRGNFDVETGIRRSDEIGELAQDFEKMKQELKEKDRLKEEFINLAAHELRTPVLPIILTAEELSDQVVNEEEKSKIERIVRNANRLNKLTKDILDVSRLESKSFKLQKEKSNIKKLILDAVQDATSKIAGGRDVKITCEFTLPVEKEELEIDKGRISEVLVNLLDNAINFTDSGTINVILEEDKDMRDNLVRVKVIDSGRGIDGSIRDKLFQKFITKSERAKGTGLGLYICKGIVEAHGGKIWAENNREDDGKGATFAFTLPLHYDL